MRGLDPLPLLGTLFLLAGRDAIVRNVKRVDAGARTYSTTFPKKEAVLSEGGLWISAGAAGPGLWGDIQTTPGLAFGVSEPTKYGDPTAILQGDWGTEQTAEAAVRVLQYARFNDKSCHEVEVRLRSSIDPSTHSITGYEVYGSLMSNNPYLHIASWGGPNGVWVNMEKETPKIYLKDGDVLKGTVTGTNPVVITMFINGVQVLQVEDRGTHKFSDGKSYGPWTSGAPGIGFYDDVDDEWSAFGISAFSATAR